MFWSSVHCELVLKQGATGRPLGCFVLFGLVFLSVLFGLFGLVGPFMEHWSDVG